MSWLLKQAEDILNRVDQQANAAINNNPTKPNGKGSSASSANDSAAILDASANLSSLNANRTTGSNTRRQKKDDDADLMEFLNSSTPAPKKTSRSAPANNNPINDNARTSSSPNMVADEMLAKGGEPIASKSATVTPRSITPAAQPIDDDEGLVLVSDPPPRQHAHRSHDEHVFLRSTFLRIRMETTLNRRRANRTIIPI